MRHQLFTRPLSVALHALLFFIFSVAAFPPQFVAAETPQGVVRVPVVAEPYQQYFTPVGGWSFGLSAALTRPSTDFIDRGSASGSAGALCADVSKDLWSSGLRYAGEFSGFRIAATASACQGFGTATQFVPLGGFDGKTSFSTFFTAGGRLEIPLNLSGLHIVPFAGVGGAYAHVKVEAFPFESNSSWRSGTYWEVGGAVPVPPKFFGMGTVQGIDAVSAEVYASWKRIGVGHQMLDGGAPTKTDLDMIMGGARIKY